MPIPRLTMARLSLVLSRAELRGEAGDAAGARDLFAAALPLAVRAHGNTDRNTLAVRHHIAYWDRESR
jgi:hypothetical protein